MSKWHLQRKKEKMARITTVKKARSHANCDKCGRDVFGQSYTWLQFMRSRKQVRCLDHPFTKRDTTRNEWQLFVYDLEDATEPGELKELIEDQQSEIEDKISNMEEYNLTGGSAYETLEERRDMLEAGLFIVEDIEEKDDMDIEELSEHAQEEYGTYKDDYLKDEPDAVEEDIKADWMEIYGQEAWEEYFDEKRDEVLGEIY